MKSLYWQMVAIALLTLIGFYLRAAHLSAVNFYHDEYLQFETAVGLLQSGEYGRYDFYHERIDKPYTRAPLFIWQVVQSLRWFGVNEVGARVPALFWGVALIPLSFVTVRSASRDPIMALLAAWIVTFNDMFIGLSRYVRMYSMVIVLSVLLVYCLYQLYHHSSGQRWWYAVGAVLTASVYASVFKEFLYALVIGFAIYAGIRTLLFFTEKNPQDRWFAYSVGSSSILTILALLIDRWLYHFLPLDAVIIRGTPHWSYFLVPFDNWQIPVLAILFAFLGVVWQPSLRTYVSCNAIIALTVLLYFVLLSHRWAADRYVSFIIPAVIIVVASGWKMLLQSIPKLQLRPLMITLAFVITGPWLSWPGLTQDGGIVWREALADKSASDLGYADVRAAYRYVAQRVQPHEIVLVQGPRFYYWPDRSIPVYRLSGYKKLSLQDFKDLACTSEYGGWFVYGLPQQRHLRDDIINYAEDHFTQHPIDNGTLVRVYHFTPDDLRQRKRSS